MKAKSYRSIIALSMLALIATIGISHYTYTPSVKQEKLDPFTIELNVAAGMTDRDITKIVSRYVPEGTSLATAINFFEARGFRVYKTRPSDWHELKSDGKDRYVAYKNDKTNIIILTKTRITLVSDGEKILNIYGKIHLTGI